MVIPDPDSTGTLPVFPDPSLDPGQNPPFIPYPVKGKKIRNHLEVLSNGTAVLFSPIFEVFKYLLTRKFYIFDMN